MADNYRKYRIFRREIPTRDGNTWIKYTTKVGVKDSNGNWDNEFFDVEFHIKGGVDIPHSTDILVPEGGEAFTFRRRLLNIPDAVLNGLRTFYSQDQKKFNYFLSDLGVKMEDGKFIKTEPFIAIYRYELANGGHNGQSNAPQGWGSAPVNQTTQTPQGWGSAPIEEPASEEIPDNFSATEDDIPF